MEIDTSSKYLPPISCDVAGDPVEHQVTMYTTCTAEGLPGRYP